MNTARNYKLAVAYSVGDPAGSGAARFLVELTGAAPSRCPLALECYETRDGVRIGGYQADTIEFEFLDETPDPGADAVIVLSRHSSTSGRPSLTTHHTGNPTETRLSGKPYKLAYSAPPLSKALLTAYRDEAEKAGILGEYQVTLEATHHGPTDTMKPLVFIEIGSTPDRWRDERAQEAMARAVARVLDTGLPECRAAAGFGEPHYPIKFTRLHLEDEYCMGHIIPKYALPHAPKTVVEQAILHTWPSPPRTALVQKKGAKSEVRKKIIEWLNELGVEVIVI